jgi:hypothetical protein
MKMSQWLILKMLIFVVQFKMGLIMQMTGFYHCKFLLGGFATSGID